MVLGIKWRQLLLQLDKDQNLHPDQHRSRPGHTATDLTLTEVLLNDIAKYSRTQLISFDNDATACYDRMIPPLMALVTLAYGMHQSTVQFNFQALHL